MPDRIEQSAPRAPRWKLRVVSLIVAGWLGAGLVGVAGAQGVDELADDALSTAQEPGEATDLDTDRTPKAKPTALWQMLHGTPYEQIEPLDGSVTAFDVDLYAVELHNERLGLAGGSRCADPPVREPGELPGAYGERVSTCERVPVMYRFTDTEEEGEVWEEVSLPGAGKPGFVGAIAWIDSTRALAVGGDGTYPRREEPRGDQEPFDSWAERDPAGKGRAWLLDGGSWEELDLARERGLGMRGMTAVAFHSGSPEFGAAGALGQVWEWEHGRFTRLIDRDSPDADLDRPQAGEYVISTGFLVRVPEAEFERRVRDIAFVDGSRVWAVAAVAGCCGATLDAEGRPDDDRPTSLSYDGDEGRWYLRFAIAPWVRPEWARRPDTPYSVHPFRFSDTGVCVGWVQSPGGPERPDEATARVDSTQSVISPASSHRQLFAPAEPGALSTVRLVAGAGVAGTGCGAALPDWSVGERRSTRLPGLGASRAVTVATHLERPEGVRIEGEPAEGDVPRVEGEDRALDPLQSLLFELPSYGLNGIDVVDGAGYGWAVGDRGAILRLSEAGDMADRARSEPPADRVGRAREAGLTDREPFDSFRLLADDVQPGMVPPLRARPRLRLDEPRMVEAGSPLPRPSSGRPEDVEEIVMSRDGAEGWAIGATTEDRPIVQRYVDGRWQRCEIEGSAVHPADPVCSGLRDLLDVELFSNDRGPVRLTAAARVPLERDGDPSTDDEFEVIAAGGDNRKDGEWRVTLARYRDGHWEREDPDAVSVGESGFGGEVTAIVFTAPDDGWLLHEDSNEFVSLYRFDGERWVDCQAPDADCGDQDRRVDLTETVTESGINPGSGVNPRRVRLRGLVAVGERIYGYGSRRADDGSLYPLIAYKDPDGKWEAERGGYDPAFEHTRHNEPPPSAELRGHVDGLAVTELAAGSYGGWAAGEQGAAPIAAGVRTRRPDSVLWRLEGSSWKPFSGGGPVDDYMRPVPGTDLGGVARTDSTRMLAIPRSGGTLDAVIAASWASGPQFGSGPMFRFRGDADRFELVDSVRPGGTMPAGEVLALAPDGEGGMWVAVGTPTHFGSGGSRRTTYFYRYTDRPHEPVFGEVPDPVTDGGVAVTDVAGAPDGSVWLSTSRDVLYRYDRLTGWDRVRVPGWDPGTVVTSPSPVNAVAVAPDGSGVAVGPGGRIARLARSGAVLDRAAGRACDLGDPVPPCSTGRDLRAVDVAADGSAIAAGDQLALLWRPAGGEFRAISRPRAAAARNIVGVSMPSPDRAWLSTNAGQIFRGTHQGDGRWSWQNEGLDASGEPVALDARGREVPLRDIALDASGHGYAVGDDGLVLERTGDGAHPWRRVHAEVRDDLTSIALPVGGGEGALIGGKSGVVLTEVGGRLEVARHGSFFVTGEVTGPVAGMALLPGVRSGQVEAWVALASTWSQGPNRLLHYASDPDEPLLKPGGRVDPLPDAPAPRPGEITFAAFGKTECHVEQSQGGCSEPGPTTEVQNLLSRRVVEEIARRSTRDGGPVFSVFTGDAIDAATGLPDRTGVRETDDASAVPSRVIPTVGGGPMKLRRWRELVADRAERAGVPLLGAIGNQDLGEQRFPDPVTGRVHSTHEHTRSGDNLAWRQSFAGRRGPWGDGSDPLQGSGGGGVSFRAVRGSGDAVELEGAAGGAHTHYAVDVERDGTAVLRLVFADSSLRSLGASDAQQQPAEVVGGQAAWLERVLCRRPGRAPTGETCTRRADLPAVVVTNTPTYSYGPSPGTETMTDAVAFETILMRHRVSVAVAGRLGWNARYWATAPGLHEPCHGQPYRDEPPRPGASACGEQAPDGGDIPAPDAPEGAGLVADALAGGGVPAPPVDPGGPSGLDPGQLTDPVGGDVPASLLSFVVASSAGGKLADQNGQARDGFWRGYSIVRLPASGDPRGVIVEQRPIYDHVIVTAQERRLRPGQRVTLRGYGRAPIATRGAGQITRFDRIDSAAVTHRYDLLEADPQRPYLPRRDASGDYVSLDPEIATVDRETGLVRAGRGQHERAFAVAVLSVGDKAASYPMVFEPRRSFRALREESAPVPVPTPHAPAPVPQVQGVPAAPPPPPPPPPPAPPPPGVSTPPFPALPALPSLGAPPAVGPPAAPAPPPTPPLPTPPSFSQAAPLGIAAEVGAIGVQGSVVPPSPPPVNPAPPGGSAARKEAKQRQAATAKSEEGQQEGGEGHMAEETQQAGGDMANQPLNAATRNEHPATALGRDRPVPSFTPLERADSATEARSLAYAGGLTLAALALALGWSTLRPTPRRRHPPQAAPAWARRRAGTR